MLFRAAGKGAETGDAEDTGTQIPGKKREARAAGGRSMATPLPCGQHACTTPRVDAQRNGAPAAPV